VDFASWEPNCRVSSARYYPGSPLDEPAKPDEWWKTPEEAQRRSDFIRQFIREQTCIKDRPDHGMRPPAARLGAPKLMVASDCQFIGRGNFQYRLRAPKRAPNDGDDFHRCGKLTWEKFESSKDFSLPGEVCSMFGAPASQQEPRRPMNPHNFGYGMALSPFLNFTDREADMTYQFYADPVRMDYCCSYRPYGWVDASCT
jgi:hypothetical protein